MTDHTIPWACGECVAAAARDAQPRVLTSSAVIEREAREAGAVRSTVERMLRERFGYSHIDADRYAQFALRGFHGAQRQRAAHTLVIAACAHSADAAIRDLRLPVDAPRITTDCSATSAPVGKMLERVIWVKGWWTGRFSVEAERRVRHAIGTLNAGSVTEIRLDQLTGP